MAKGAPEPQQQGGDRSLDFLWLIVIIVAMVMAVWYFGKIYIAMAIFQVKLCEIIAVNFSIQYWAKLISLLNLPISIPTPDLTDLYNWIDFINKNYGSTVEFQRLSDLSEAIGKYIRIPVAFVLFSLGLTLYFAGISQKFRRSYSMYLLKKEEQVNWPQYSPVAKLNLTQTLLDDKPWAVAQDPMRFCRANNLLNEEIEKDGKHIVFLRQGAAYRVLSLQLGPRWQGVKALPIHLQALFAIFAACINGDKNSANELTDNIARSSGNGKPIFYNTAELLAKYANTRAVQKIVNIHGYVSTVMASLLAASREAGVLSTAEFIWLKPLDRRMWYMLNSVGRYTAVAETAGAFAHWLAEKKLGLPLMVPMVEEAIKGLDLAIKEVLYKPNEEAEQGSASANKT